MKKRIKKIFFTNKFVEAILLQLSRITSLAIRFYPLNTDYPELSMRKVKRDNLNFELDISDYQEYLVYFNLDSDSSKPLLEYIPDQNGLIIDVGANIGQTSLWIANHVMKQSITIIAFEPSPITFNKLTKNISLNKFSTIKIENIALGNSDSKLLMIQDCVSNSGTFKVCNSDVNHPGNHIEVIQLKLDTFLEKATDKILFIKIDVEGFEYKVLLGAKEIIRKNKPILYIELSFINLKNQGYAATDLIELLKSYGYNSILNIVTLKEIDLTDLVDCHFDILCKIIEV